MTKEIICKRLYRVANVPKTLVMEYAKTEIDNNFNSIIESFRNQLQVTDAKSMGNTQIFFLTGNKSYKKNLLMTTLLAESIKQNITTSYTTGQSIIDNKLSYGILNRVYAIDDADLIGKQDFKVISFINFILKVMKNNGILIICCQSLDSIKDIIGKDTMNFLSNYALDVIIKHESSIIETVEI